MANPTTRYHCGLFCCLLTSKVCIFRAVPPENRPVPQKVYRRPVMRRQEPAERSRHICGTSLESSMLAQLYPGTMSANLDDARLRASGCVLFDVGFDHVVIGHPSTNVLD